MPDHELMSKIILESRQLAQLNQKLAERLHASQETARRLKEDVSHLQNNYEESTTDARIKFLKEQIEEKDTEIARFKSAIREHDKDISRRDKEIASLRELVDSLNKKIAAKNSLVNELARNLESKDELFEQRKKAEDELRKRIEELGIELNDRTGKITNMRLIVDRLEEELKSVSDELTVKEGRIRETVNELERVRVHNSKLMAELTKQKHNVQVLMDDLLIKDRLIHDLKKTNIEKNKGVRKLSGQLKVLQEQMTAVDKSNTEIIKKLHKAQAVNKDLEDELAHQLEINNKLESHFRTLLKVQEEKHATRIKALIAEHTRSELDLKAQIAMRKEEREETLQSSIEVPMRPITGSVSNIGFMQATSDELVPMIKTALDHGDSEEKIVHSLVNSGYEKEIVKKAINKAKV